MGNRKTNTKTACFPHFLSPVSTSHFHCRPLYPRLASPKQCRVGGVGNGVFEISPKHLVSVIPSSLHFSPAPVLVLSRAVVLQGKNLLQWGSSLEHGSFRKCPSALAWGPPRVAVWICYLLWNNSSSTEYCCNPARSPSLSSFLTPLASEPSFT